MAVKLHQTETTIEAALADGYSILTDLRDECQEAYDNTPESLQSGDRASALETAVDELGNHCDETPWDELQKSFLETQVGYLSNRRKGQSRSDRRDEAVRMIEAGQAGLQAITEELETSMKASLADDPGSEIEDEDERMINQVALNEVIDRLGECVDECGSVYFPGRNG